MAALGGIASSLGGNTGNVGNLASLISGFQSLKLDSSLISQFIPIIISFVQSSENGEALKDILGKVLK